MSAPSLECDLLVEDGVSHGFLIGIKTDVFALLGHIHTIFYRTLHPCGIRNIVSDEAVICLIESAAECIRHGHQFNILLGEQGLKGRTGTTPATTNQGDFNGVIRQTVGSMGEGKAAEHGSSGQHRGGFEKIAS